MIRTLKEVQKGWIFYLITLGMALLVALFGPTGPIQILNMLTVTAGVLLMLLVITLDGYHKAGWPQLGLHRAGWRYWPLALLAPTAVLIASFSSHRCWNPLRVPAERVRQPVAGGDCARHLQRGPRSAGGRSCGRQLNTAAYVTGETGVFTLLALVILAWMLMRRSARQKEDHLVAQSKP